MMLVLSFCLLAMTVAAKDFTGPGSVTCAAYTRSSSSDLQICSQQSACNGGSCGITTQGGLDIQANQVDAVSYELSCACDTLTGCPDVCTMQGTGTGVGSQNNGGTSAASAVGHAGAAVGALVAALALN